MGDLGPGIVALVLGLAWWACSCGPGFVGLALWAWPCGPGLVGLALGLALGLEPGAGAGILEVSGPLQPDYIGWGNGSWEKR